MADSPGFSRAEGWAEDRPERMGGHNPWLVAVRFGRQLAEDRVSGLAAEMAFFALLSLVPLIVALGAALGFLERIIGAEEVARGEAAVIDGLAVVFSPELTDDVIAPFVSGLLAQERTGLALGGLLVTFWLASRVFTATIRALDSAYGVEDPRGLVEQRALALLFALLAVVVTAMTLTLMVVGPLLGGGRVLAERFGLGDVFALLWSVGRWPVLVAIVVGFLALVYRFGPAVDNRWRDCLPGAAVGVGLWILVSLGFRLYLAVGGPQTPQFGEEQEALAIAGRTVGALVAAVVWTYLSGMVILVGGEVNAELARLRAARTPLPRDD